MSDHVSIDRMNDALDGSLPPDEIAEIEAHTARCAACRREYERLSALVAAVRSLPREARVPAGSWDAVAGRIASADRVSLASSTVVPLPTSSPAPGTPTATKRISASLPQLAAAAIVVALLSAGVTWMALGSPGVADAPRGARAGATAGSAMGAAARAVSRDDGRYAETVARLEEIVEAGRGMLAPETVVTIEESLRTVDAAIAEVEVALAEDPNSGLLLRLLADHRKTKLGVLQRAAAAVDART